QMALIKIIDAQAIEDISFSERLTFYPKVSVSALPQLQEKLVKEVSTPQVAAMAGGLQTATMDALLAEVLASSLLSLGLIGEEACRTDNRPWGKQAAPFHERWLSTGIRHLQQRELLADDLTVSRKVGALPDLLVEWEQKRSVWAEDPDLRA